MPLTDFVLFTDEAFDKLGQEVHQVVFLSFGEVGARYESDGVRDWLNLIGLSDLLGELCAALLSHDILVHAGEVAKKIDLVHITTADKDVGKESLLL